MSSFGLWQISERKPVRIEASNLELERDLQSWIQEDPELLLSGLRIIGSEVRLDGGRARADLIGVDVQGRLTIIELKRGAVFRETVAQALDYAACLEEFDGERLRDVATQYLKARGTSLIDVIPEAEQVSIFDEGDREIRVIVVGVGQDPALARLVGFLSRRSDLDVSVVSFQVYSVGGTALLGREVTESSPPSRERSPSQDRSLEAVRALAARNGVAGHLERTLALAEELGLPARPYKYSVMVTPPSNRSRMLFTVSVQTPQVFQLYSYAPAFKDFFSIPEDAARERLGPDGWREMTLESLETYAAALSGLIDREGEEGL